MTAFADAYGNSALPTSHATPTTQDPGQDVSATSGSATQFASAATSTGEAVFCALWANTDSLWLGRSNGVTATKGIELAQGEKIRLPCANVNEWFAISSSGTQHVHAVAL